MRISDWSSDVCSSDLVAVLYGLIVGLAYKELTLSKLYSVFLKATISTAIIMFIMNFAGAFTWMITIDQIPQQVSAYLSSTAGSDIVLLLLCNLILLFVGCFMNAAAAITVFASIRSEEHTSELQSLLRISYAVLCLKNKN